MSEPLTRICAVFLSAKRQSSGQSTVIQLWGVNPESALNNLHRFSISLTVLTISNFIIAFRITYDTFIMTYVTPNGSLKVSCYYLFQGVVEAWCFSQTANTPKTRHIFTAVARNVATLPLKSTGPCCFLMQLRDTFNTTCPSRRMWILPSGAPFVFKGLNQFWNPTSADASMGQVKQQQEIFILALNPFNHSL